MIFLRFLFILFVSAAAMGWLILPIASLILHAPAHALADKHPKLAFGLMLVSAPVGWGINLTWFAYTIYFVRLYSFVSKWWLIPLYIFIGWGSALSITSDDPEAGMFRLMWCAIWIIMTILAFIFWHPIRVG